MDIVPLEGFRHVSINMIGDGVPSSRNRSRNHRAVAAILAIPDRCSGENFAARLTILRGWLLAGVVELFLAGCDPHDFDGARDDVKGRCCRGGSFGTRRFRYLPSNMGHGDGPRLTDFKPRVTIHGQAPDHGRPDQTAPVSSSSSIFNNLLYFAVRSERESEPVLMCRHPRPTARSAMVVSSVSPERCDMTVR